MLHIANISQTGELQPKMETETYYRSTAATETNFSSSSNVQNARVQSFSVISIRDQKTTKSLSCNSYLFYWLVLPV